MKRVIYVALVLLFLAGCSMPEPAPTPESVPEDFYAQDIYELTFSVERVSGGSAQDWKFTYNHNDDVITSGHRVLLSKEVFTFYHVRVDVAERGAASNSYSASFPVALCEVGSGKTEIVVTSSDGRTSTFKVICTVKRVGKC